MDCNWMEIEEWFNIVHLNLSTGKEFMDLNQNVNQSCPLGYNV